MVGVNRGLYTALLTRWGSQAHRAEVSAKLTPLGELLWYDHCFSVHQIDL